MNFFESLDDTNQKTVLVSVLLQVIDVGLVEIAQITNAQNRRSNRKIQRQHVPQRRCIERLRQHNVMVVVSLIKNFVVRLSVVWTEHQTDERNIDFVAQSDGMISYVEAIGCCCSRRQSQSRIRLRYIIRITRVIQETDSAVNQSASLKR